MGTVQCALLRVQTAVLEGNIIKRATLPSPFHLLRHCYTRESKYKIDLKKLKICVKESGERGIMNHRICPRYKGTPHFPTILRFDGCCADSQTWHSRCRGQSIPLHRFQAATDCRSITSSIFDGRFATHTHTKLIAFSLSSCIRTCLCAR